MKMIKHKKRKIREIYGKFPLNSQDNEKDNVQR